MIDLLLIVIYVWLTFLFSIAGLDFLADGGADFEHAITVTGKKFTQDLKDSRSQNYLYHNFINIHVRFRKVSLHAAGHLRSNLHGHSDWRDDTLVRAPGGAMRLRDGLHRERLADRLSDARSVSGCHSFALNHKSITDWSRATRDFIEDQWVFRWSSVKILIVRFSVSLFDGSKISSQN